MPETPPPAAGHRRDLATRRSVLLADRIADGVIRVGGIGVIVAVFAIVAFLAQVATPLFAGAGVTGKRAAVAASPDRVLGLWLDEYKTCPSCCGTRARPRSFTWPAAGRCRRPGSTSAGRG